MKKRMNYFLAAVLLLSASCEDDNIFKQLVDPPAKVLPPATQTGANTFGCKVNGEVWLPSETAWMEFKNQIFNLQARDMRNNKFNVINIYIKNVTSTGKYNIYSINNQIYPSQASCGSYYTGDSCCLGEITFLKVDTSMINYIVSGTFSFKAKHATTNETIEITEGRFDLRKQ